MGLAPVIVERLLPVVRAVADSTGAAVILVEQHVQLALEVADTAMVMRHGNQVLRGDAAELAATPDVIENAYMGGGVRFVLSGNRTAGQTLPISSPEPADCQAGSSARLAFSNAASVRNTESRLAVKSDTFALPLKPESF